MTTARLNGIYGPSFTFKQRQHFRVGSVMPSMDANGRDVPVGDARTLQREEGVSEAEFFARHSFVLLDHASAVRDWDMDTAIYHREIEEVIRERLFPDRNLEVQQSGNVLRRGRGTSTPAYADGVHSDGGLDAEDYIYNVEAFAGEEAARWWRELYNRPHVEGLVWIDFWRPTNMRGALEHMPLALCDPASVEPCDVVPLALTGIAPEDRETHHLALRFHAEQRWYYYPQLHCDELLAFKLAEFWKVPKPFRNCFHSAFADPRTPLGAEERQSCEHRVGVLMLTDARPGLRRG
jgi:hypothetical protein